MSIFDSSRWNKLPRCKMSPAEDFGSNRILTQSWKTAQNLWLGLLVVAVVAVESEMSFIRAQECRLLDMAFGRSYLLEASPLYERTVTYERCHFTQSVSVCRDAVWWAMVLMVYLSLSLVFLFSFPMFLAKGQGFCIINSDDDPQWSHMRRHQYCLISPDSFFFLFRKLG